MSSKKAYYPLLKTEQFEKIGKETGYATDYVRQIIRGYVEVNDRTQKILDKADKIIDELTKNTEQ